MSLQNKNGFTLIEVVVVMAIIAVLAVLVTGAINVARKQARNTQRINDLRTIQTALVSYQTKYHNWIEASSGCGWQGTGNGYFNYSDGFATGYPKSIMQCIIDGGVLQREVIDPTGGTSLADGYAYMKYTCGGGKTYLFAKLEDGPANDETQTLIENTCCSQCGNKGVGGVGAGYGMNYVMAVD